MKIVTFRIISPFTLTYQGKSCNFSPQTSEQYTYFISDDALLFIVSNKVFPVAYLDQQVSAGRIHQYVIQDYDPRDPSCPCPTELVAAPAWSLASHYVPGNLVWQLGILYRCNLENNDMVFDPLKWDQAGSGSGGGVEHWFIDTVERDLYYLGHPEELKIGKTTCGVGTPVVPYTYTDTNVWTEGAFAFRGPAGDSPYIGSNGNWFIGSLDTGVPARGPAGTSSDLSIGPNGNWFINGLDTGVQAQGEPGPPGDDGIGISSTDVLYVIGNDGTTIPTSGWASDIPAVPQGKWLWKQTTINFTSGPPSVSYDPTYQGVDGGGTGGGISDVPDPSTDGIFLSLRRAVKSGVSVIKDWFESTAVGSALLSAVDASAARAAIGAGTSDFSGAYADLLGLPTLGTASEKDVSYFASADQGSKAESALQPSDVRKFSKLYYVDPTNSADTSPNGSTQKPYSSLSSLISAHPSETDVLVYLRNSDSIPIENVPPKWTICSTLGAKDASRVNVASVKSINGDSNYLIGVVVNGVSENTASGSTYTDNVTFKSAVSYSGGYKQLNNCSFMDNVISSATVDLINCDFEDAATITNSGTLILQNNRNVSLIQTAGLTVINGSDNFIPPAPGGFGINITGGSLIAFGGKVTNPDGSLAPIYIGAGVAFSIDELVFDRANSQILSTNNLRLGKDASQIRHGLSTGSFVSPSDLSQKAFNEAVSHLLQTMSSPSAFGDRGIVLNAFTGSQVTVIDSVAVADGGIGGYSVGDVLYIKAPVQSSQLLKAWAIVASVDGSGKPLTVDSLNPGAFTAFDDSAPVQTDTTGSGTGCTLTVTTDVTTASTTASITSPTEGDTVDVLNDETNGNQHYRYSYADRNQDGVANWIPLFPITDVSLQADNISTVIVDGVVSVKSGRYALDSDAVKLSGNQTINGEKTFGTMPKFPSKTTAAANSGTSPATEAQVYSVAGVAGSAMQPNSPITGSRKTKISYDSRGLVTGGEDLEASDIPALPESKISGLISDLASKAPALVSTKSTFTAPAATGPARNWYYLGRVTVPEDHALEPVEIHFQSSMADAADYSVNYFKTTEATIKIAADNDTGTITANAVPRVDYQMFGGTKGGVAMIYNGAGYKDFYVQFNCGALTSQYTMRVIAESNSPYFTPSAADAACWYDESNAPSGLYFMFAQNNLPLNGQYGTNETELYIADSDATAFCSRVLSGNLITGSYANSAYELSTVFYRSATATYTPTTVGLQLKTQSIGAKFYFANGARMVGAFSLAGSVIDGDLILNINCSIGSLTTSRMTVKGDYTITQQRVGNATTYPQPLEAGPITIKSFTANNNNIYGNFTHTLPVIQGDLDGGFFHPVNVIGAYTFSSNTVNGNISITETKSWGICSQIIGAVVMNNNACNGTIIFNRASTADQAFTNGSTTTGSNQITGCTNAAMTSQDAVDSAGLVGLVITDTTRLGSGVLATIMAATWVSGTSVTLTIDVNAIADGATTWTTRGFANPITFRALTERGNKAAYIQNIYFSASTFHNGKVAHTIGNVDISVNSCLNQSVALLTINTGVITSRQRITVGTITMTGNTTASDSWGVVASLGGGCDVGNITMNSNLSSQGLAVQDIASQSSDTRFLITGTITMLKNTCSQIAILGLTAAAPMATDVIVIAGCKAAPSVNGSGNINKIENVRPRATAGNNYLSIYGNSLGEMRFNNMDFTAAPYTQATAMAIGATDKDDKTTYVVNSTCDLNGKILNVTNATCVCKITDPTKYVRAGISGRWFDYDAPFALVNGDGVNKVPAPDHTTGQEVVLATLQYACDPSASAIGFQADFEIDTARSTEAPQSGTIYYNFKADVSSATVTGIFNSCRTGVNDNLAPTIQPYIILTRSAARTPKIEICVRSSINQAAGDVQWSLKNISTTQKSNTITSITFNNTQRTRVANSTTVAGGYPPIKNLSTKTGTVTWSNAFKPSPDYYNSIKETADFVQLQFYGSFANQISAADTVVAAVAGITAPTTGVHGSVFTPSGQWIGKCSYSTGSNIHIYPQAVVAAETQLTFQLMWVK